MQMVKIDDDMKPLLPVAAPVDIDLKWYVLLTEPQGEARAERRLNALGFCPYVPRERVIKIRTRRTMFGEFKDSGPCMLPIFRGYLLCPLNLDWSFGSLYSVPGLRQNGHPFLRHNDKPVTLSDVIVERIRLIEEALSDPANIGLPYKAGDKVQITEGAFLDFVAQITKLDDATRIEAEIDIFGRKTMIHLKAHQIAPLQ